MHRQMADMMKSMGKKGLMGRMLGGLPNMGSAAPPAIDPEALQRLGASGALPKGLTGLPGLPGLPGRGMPGLPGLPKKK
jgi:signal recognition particle subunit SRP54